MSELYIHRPISGKKLIIRRGPDGNVDAELERVPEWEAAC